MQEGMSETLASLLDASAVPVDTLHERYGALMELVRKLIGVVPNCDPYLEIWPVGFRTYNVMVPNFLNLPFLVWGVGAPKEVIGLGMYVASRTAGCAYCSGHLCAFALRRGTSKEKIAHALDALGAHGAEVPYTPAERALMAVARALAGVPGELDEAARAELRRHFPEAQVKWLVLAIAMMGFLNKFMDAIGVELEGSTLGEVEEILGPSGWAPGKHAGAVASAAEPPRADTLGTKLSIVPQIPAALALDRRWTTGVPDRWPAAGDLLREHTGHDFPVLGHLRHGRAIRAIAVMIRDNLDAETTVVGLAEKCLAGIVYATVVGDAALGAEVRRLAEHNRVAPALVEAAARFAAGEGDAPSTVLRLARAVSPSPADVDAAVLEASRALQPAAIVELVVWISVLQMLHRLAVFYPTASA
jgi:alkylhydroperoxidase family enzyme